MEYECETERETEEIRDYFSWGNVCKVLPNMGDEAEVKFGIMKSSAKGEA